MLPELNLALCFVVAGEPISLTVIPTPLETGLFCTCFAEFSAFDFVPLACAFARRRLAAFLSAGVDVFFLGIEEELNSKLSSFRGPRDSSSCPESTRDFVTFRAAVN